MTEKLQPHNLDAEEAVIGSLLIDGSTIYQIATFLGKEHFYHEQNQWLYEACRSLYDRNEAINQITVAQELARQEKLESCGGAAFLSHLISICPTSLDIEHYARIVHRLAVMRSLISAGGQIATLGYEASPDLAHTLKKADELILELRKEGGPAPIITPEERVRDLNERYTNLFKLETGIAIPTGLKDLDRCLGGGLYEGDLIVVGARPGVGKTTLLENLSNHIGQTKKVLFCSGEMDVNGLSDRDVASVVGVPISTIRLGGYDPDLYIEITGRALEALSKLDVYHFEASRSNAFNTSNIYQAALQTQLRYGLDVIVVDYLGLLTDKYGNTQNDRIGYITRVLKEMARTLRVPLLVAHQLNRATESREEKRPQLHDLRDSGNIEQDADVVLFIYRESYYGKPGQVTELLIAKQRQGPSGKKVKVYFDDDHRVYRDLAYQTAETSGEESGK